MRIIHIVENLDKGAVENWLVMIFLRARKLKPEWEWTFYCILGKPGRLDNIVREAGGKILYSPVWINDKVVFLRELRKELKTGRYDIIHSHHDYLSGFYLLASTGIRFKKRILHIHNTDAELPTSTVLRPVLLKLLKKVAIFYSDIIVGISNDTLAEFVGKSSTGNKLTTVIYYGIDMSKFSFNQTFGFSRELLGISKSAKIILFVGRMNELKNPSFVIDLLSEINKVRGDVHAIFVGKGGKESEVLEKAKKYSIEDKIHLMGWRDDVAELMYSSDLFVFPRIEHPKEGFGLVVIEAQAAGLPMLLSFGIVKDTIEIPELAHFISLSKTPNDWAKKALEVLAMEKPSPSVSLRKMKNSKFEADNACRNFLKLYE